MTMTGSSPSSDEQARALAATLVRMARSEGPSRTAYHRALGAMAKAGVAGGLLAGSSATAGVAVSSKSGLSAIPLSIAKWGAVAAVGGAIAIGAPKITPHVALLHTQNVVHTPEPAKERPLHKGTEPSVHDTPAPAPTVVASIAVPLSTLPAPPPHRPERAPHPVRTSDVLLTEVGELDDARALLRERAADRALAALAAYSERHPDGSLRVEATVLRIEALAMSGRRGPALALAKAFLETHAQTPLAYRVRDIVDQLTAAKE
jgi:hypothetical protein